MATNGRGGAPIQKWRKVLRLLERNILLPGVCRVVKLLSTTRYLVDGDSMQPSLAGGQHILVSRMACRFGDPSRGSVVVLRDPGQDGRHCIKRIIGLPGEHIQIDGSQILIDGYVLRESYRHETPQSCYTSQWVLGADEFFVLGDYRQNSRDSRSFGPIQRHNIIGEVWRRYWLQKQSKKPV